MQAWSSLLAGAEVEHVRGWLHQIVRNATWKSAARTPGSVELPEGLVGSPSPHEEVEDRIAVSTMVSEVNKLPDRQRTALVQTALEGRSRQEIAVGLGLSESAVRQLVHRGRSTVRAACTALTPGPMLAWAATPRHGSSMSERVAEALAGGGAAGSRECWSREVSSWRLPARWPPPRSSRRTILRPVARELPARSLRLSARSPTRAQRRLRRRVRAGGRTRGRQTLLQRPRVVAATADQPAVVAASRAARPIGLAVLSGA